MALVSVCVRQLLLVVGVGDEAIVVGRWQLVGLGRQPHVPSVFGHASIIPQDGGGGLEVRFGRWECCPGLILFVFDFVVIEHSHDGSQHAKHI